MRCGKCSFLNCIEIMLHQVLYKFNVKASVYLSTCVYQYISQYIPISVTISFLTFPLSSGRLPRSRPPVLRALGRRHERCQHRGRIAELSAAGDGLLEAASGGRVQVHPQREGDRGGCGRVQGQSAQLCDLRARGECWRAFGASFEHVMNILSVSVACSHVSARYFTCSVYLFQLLHITFQPVSIFPIRRIVTSSLRLLITVTSSSSPFNPPPPPPTPTPTPTPPPPPPPRHLSGRRHPRAARAKALH
jgi:hypothetical protein